MPPTSFRTGACWRWPSATTKSMWRKYIKDGLLDGETFAAKSEPKDLFELVRKEDVDALMKVFPVTRLHYVATDGCAPLAAGGDRRDGR